MEISFNVIAGKGYHKDLIIKVGNEEFLADTYYFWNDEINHYDNPYHALHKVISDYFLKWTAKLMSLQQGEEVFMPIDFSDQYIGGFRIKSQNQYFNITYGFICDISNLVLRVEEENIITNLNEKELEPLISFEIEKVAFVKALSVHLQIQ